MGCNGRKSTDTAKVNQQKGQYARRNDWWKHGCEKNVRGSGEETDLQRYKFNSGEGMEGGNPQKSGKIGVLCCWELEP